MSNNLQQFSNHTLEAIKHCHSKDEVKTLIGGSYFKLQKKMRSPKDDKCINVTPFKGALEIADIPIEILYSVLGFATFGVATLWILGSVGLVALTLFIGAFYYYSKKLQAKMTAETNTLELMEIKVQVLDELIKRYQPENVSLLNADEKKPNCAPVPYKKSICFAVSMAVFLGATYWGITDILLIAGLVTATSLLVSPIGLAIAGSAALLFSAALAIYHHQFLQKNNVIKNAKKTLYAEYNKRETCLDVLKKIKNSDEKENIKVNQAEISAKKLQELKLSRHGFFKSANVAPAVSLQNERVRSFSY